MIVVLCCMGLGVFVAWLTLFHASEKPQKDTRLILGAVSGLGVGVVGVSIYIGYRILHRLEPLTTLTNSTPSPLTTSPLTVPLTLDSSPNDSPINKLKQYSSGELRQLATTISRPDSSG